MKWLLCAVGLPCLATHAFSGPGHIRPVQAIVVSNRQVTDFTAHQSAIGHAKTIALTSGAGDRVACRAPD